VHPRSTLVDFLLGEKLPSGEARSQRVGIAAGVSLVGLDALASAAYGPEAALTVLMPLGAKGLERVLPLSAAITGLLLIVFFSYRQTIAAYSGGGGSYTVAKENLGTAAGLVAATGLSLDYVLNVAVAISAGVGALVSAVPSLLPHTLVLCLLFLAVLALVNLRGVRASGRVFMAPTYLFLVCLLAAIAVGALRTAASGGHPVPVVPPPPLSPETRAATTWLLLRAFSSGCTAMTGVEAVSNGVPNFRPPEVRRAQRTLGVIVVSLTVLILGIAFLCRSYGIGATPPGRSGYQSVLSEILGAVFGRGIAYHVSIAAIIMVLALSANTSFADFPRVWRLLASDHFVPEVFAHRGRRLVFSHGIYALTAFSTLLLVFFRGITDRLIPLFAVGAFLAFTLSQAGMVAHWWRRRSRSTWHSLVINAVGTVATGAALIVIFVSKFSEGAWLTLLVVPLAIVMFLRARWHHDWLARQIELRRPVDLSGFGKPIVIVPLRRRDRIAEKGLRLAYELSGDVHAVQVLSEEQDVEDLRASWKEFAEDPARAEGLPPPKLELVHSAYREFYTPLLDYIEKMRERHPEREIAVVLPELIERRWYHFFFGVHRQAILRKLLLWREGPKVIVVSTPWYLGERS
jgi:amino acid transporter